MQHFRVAEGRFLMASGNSPVVFSSVEEAFDLVFYPVEFSIDQPPATESETESEAAGESTLHDSPNGPKRAVRLYGRGQQTKQSNSE